MRDCSRWHASRRRHKFRTIRNALDRGIYGIVILKSEDEGIHLDYPEEKLEEDFNECIELLSKIERGKKDRSEVDRFHLEVIQFMDSEDIDVSTCLNKVESYNKNRSTDSDCEKLLSQLRKVENFVSKNIESTDTTI